MGRGTLWKVRVSYLVPFGPLGENGMRDIATKMENTELFFFIVECLVEKNLTSLTDMISPTEVRVAHVFFFYFIFVVFIFVFAMMNHVMCGRETTFVPHLFLLSMKGATSPRSSQLPQKNAVIIHVYCLVFVVGSYCWYD